MKTTILKFSAITLGLFFFSQVNAQENDQKKKFSPEKVIEKLDTNKDGKISIEEAQKAEKGKLKENFSKIDTNSDGFIDLEELKAHREAKKQEKEQKEN